MQHAPFYSSSSVVAATASRIYGFSDERSVRFGLLLRVYFVNEFSAYENGPYFKYLDELEETRAPVPPRRRRQRIPARSYRPSIAATLKTHGNVGLGRKQTQLERVTKFSRKVSSHTFYSSNSLQSDIPRSVEDGGGGREAEQNGTFVVSEAEESPSLIPTSP